MSNTDALPLRRLEARKDIVEPKRAWPITDAVKQEPARRSPATLQALPTLVNDRTLKLLPSVVNDNMLIDDANRPADRTEKLDPTDAASTRLRSVPNRQRPDIDADEPSRANARIDKVLPKLAQRNTLNPAPSLAVDLTETEDPNNMYSTTEERNTLPTFKNPATLIPEPTRQKLRNDTEDPKFA
jgi:hypothetical protein